MEILGFIHLCTVLCQFVHLIPDDEMENKASMSLSFMGDGIPDAVVGFFLEGVEACGSSFSPRKLNCQSVCLADCLNPGMAVGCPLLAPG